MLWTRTRPAKLDYELVFNLMPGMCLVLDRELTIVAQNFEHAMVSLSLAKDVVGKNLFEAFPDNPNHAAAGGKSVVHASLLKVLKTRDADVMPVIRHDVQGERGPYQVRWWAITNTPILGEDGAVRWIIHRAEDVTELYELRRAAGKVG
jgi:PAS domain-containing protein